MIVHENGHTDIEAPELPVEQVVHYIVKDYRRMYNGYSRLESRCAKYKGTIDRMNNHIFALHHIVNEQKKVADRLARMLKKAGIEPPECYKDMKVHKF